MTGQARPHNAGQTRQSVANLVVNPLLVAHFVGNIRLSAFHGMQVMTKEIPAPTIHALARSIFKDASSYGFRQVDIIRLVNELMDLCTSGTESSKSDPAPPIEYHVDQDNSPLQLPLIGEQVKIRAFRADNDEKLLEKWLPDKYGRYFVLSCATAQTISVDTLTKSPGNHLGIITLHDDFPIGAMAYLDHNKSQKRAELRKLIGHVNSRGRGLAEEATRLWVRYGMQTLGLEKIYVSTLQTHISNIKLNEDIGFRVEGLLRNEVLIDGQRRDVLRMGILQE